MQSYNTSFRTFKYFTTFEIRRRKHLFFFDCDIKELLHLYYIITLLSSLKGIDIIKSSDIDVTIKNNFMKT